MKISPKAKLMVSVSISVMLMIALMACLFQIERLSRHNSFHRNSMLEYEYLMETINNSNKTLQYFKDKWGKDFIKESEPCCYEVEANVVLKDPFFHEKQKAYGFKAFDFYGYVFEFDPRGKLIRGYMLKP